jgi:hypothetical protein
MAVSQDITIELHNKAAAVILICVLVFAVLLPMVYAATDPWMPYESIYPSGMQSRPWISQPEGQRVESAVVCENKKTSDALH